MDLTALIEMLSGVAVKVNAKMFQNDAINFKNCDDVFTYLIHLGYLGYDYRTQSAFVPNEEIRQEEDLQILHLLQSLSM